MVKPLNHENIQLKTSVATAAVNLVKPKSRYHKTYKIDHFQLTTQNVVKQHVKNFKLTTSNMVVTCSPKNVGSDVTYKAMVKPCYHETN